MTKVLIMLTMAISMQLSAQQSNHHFQNTATTTASPDKIWAVWTDVPNWKKWDKGLKEAQLNGVFAPNTEGVLMPDKGPKSKFIISEVEAGKSYTFKTKIPFGWLIIKRYLVEKNGVTYFTHDVQFTGILKKLLGKKLGVNYRKMLPEVMDEIKKIVEVK